MTKNEQISRRLSRKLKRLSNNIHVRDVYETRAQVKHITKMKKRIKY